jgi:hypothetical protein
LADGARRHIVRNASIAALAVLASAGASGVARADWPRLRVHVAAGSCPDAALIREQLEPLLGAGTAVDVDDAELGRADAGHAAITDLGDRYVVEIHGLRRELPDEARDCVERARVATVFIALNLEDAPPPPTPPPPAPPAPIAAPPPRPYWRAGALVFGGGAYAPEARRAAPGAGLGLWLGHDALRFDVDLGFVAPAALELEHSGSVALLRLPLALSVNYAWRARGFRVGPSLGAQLELWSLQGRDVARPQHAWRFNAGLLLALDAQLALSRALVLWLRLSGAGFPRRYDLRVEPAGELGDTPRAWLQGQLGVGWQFQ